MHWMNSYNYNFMMPFWGFPGIIGGLFIFLVVIWSLVWKGRALWHAARNGNMGWFVTLLVINTLGILEILYLYVFSKKQKPVT